MVQTTEQLSHMVLQEAERRRNVYDVLQERGFVAQVSDEAGLRAALERPVTLYCGYDPTAPSLHIGHQLTIMALAHFQLQPRPCRIPRLPSHARPLSLRVAVGARARPPPVRAAPAPSSPSPCRDR